MLKEAVPAVQRVTVVWDDRIGALQFGATQAAARVLDIVAQSASIRHEREAEEVVRHALTAKSQAIVMLTSPIVLSAGPGDRGADDDAGAGVPAGLSDPGEPQPPHGTEVAAVGPDSSPERSADARALGCPPAAAVASAGPRGAGPGADDAEPGGAAGSRRGGGRRI
jgi:hypothetical protein